MTRYVSHWRAHLLAAAALAVVPGVARAHAVIYPKTSVANGFEKYILRVPNERDVPTTRIEIHFPDGLRVESFAEVPGWQLQVIMDSSKAITGAIWTGTLAAQRFVEFAFEAKNPKTSTQLAWPVYQTYANGERVEWTGPARTKTPAPITMIQAPSLAASIGQSGWVSGGALLLALIALGLVMRRPSSAPAASALASN